MKIAFFFLVSVFFLSSCSKAFQSAENSKPGSVFKAGRVMIEKRGLQTYVLHFKKVVNADNFNENQKGVSEIRQGDKFSLIAEVGLNFNHSRILRKITKQKGAAVNNQAKLAVNVNK